MYSVVLATMLAAGGNTPAWHHCHSCYSGCYSGYSCYSSCSCYGGYSGYSGYAGYSGYGCSSCHSCHGRIFPIFGHRHHAVCSTCSYGCNCGGYVYGCSTCTSCFTCSTAVYGSPQVIAVPSANPEADALRKEVDQLRKALDKSEKLAPPRGADKVSTSIQTSRVTVSLPTDARLWVENVECPLTSSVRSFDTPPLNARQQYVYNMKVEVIRDGQPISETQRVIITPGQEVRVDFNKSAVVGTAAR